MNARVKSTAPACDICGGHCHDVWSTVESALVAMEFDYLSQREEGGIVIVSGADEGDARWIGGDAFDHGYEAIATPNIEDRWCVLVAETGVLTFGEDDDAIEWRQGDAEQVAS